MRKHEIRKLYLQKRKALSVQEVIKFNNKIKIHFGKFLPSKVKTAHIYLPIQSKVEIDTLSIIRELWVQKIRVVVPVMNLGGNSMSSCLLTEDTQIVINHLEVPEPVNCTEINDNEIDAIVFPLLAFNNKGYRVGYGKGYYDKFIAALGHEVLKIGLSYFAPIEQISDLNHWDVPLDYCITPDEVIRFW